MVIEGMTHEEHTSDAEGKFKHPYDHVSTEVATIHYPQSKAFSVKLVPTAASEGDSLSVGKDQSSLLINPNVSLYEESENIGFLERFSDMLEPAKAANDSRISLTNQLNIWYSGTLYMGTPH